MGRKAGLRIAAKPARAGVPAADPLAACLNQKVVIDLRTEYVCLGTLKGYDKHFLVLKNADLHDLRDTDTTRENYVAESVATGIKRNRKRVLIARSEVVALAKLEDVVDE
jgi:small nuclear ribonucleoprotein (snRNP)-like protein